MITNKMKKYALMFVLYIAFVFIFFSISFNLNARYYNVDKPIEPTNNVVENIEKNDKPISINENGIDISRLSTKKNISKKVPKVLTDDEVIYYLEKSNDPDIKKILEHREELNMNYMRLLNSNIESKYFIKDILNNKNPLSFKGESVKFSRNIPYYLQWDRRWGNEDYAGGNLALNGCGPTSMAMVVSGLLKNDKITPVSIIKDLDPKYVQAGVTTWQFFRDIPVKYGIKVKDVSPIKKLYFDELKKGNPIIVSVKAGDFTSVGHIFVLVGIEDNMIVINDPNSPNKSNERWSFERLKPQIKNSWLFTK